MGFSGILGQDQAVSLLKRLWANSSKPSFLLFFGPRGVGRKLAAVTWAQALLCRQPDEQDGGCGQCENCRQIGKSAHPDCTLIDFSYQEKLTDTSAAGRLVIDTLRETIPLLKQHPLTGRHSVAIVDGAEDLTLAAQISLLKILEESPPHLKWIWIALDEGRLLPTIVSRASGRVYFRPLEKQILAEILIHKTNTGPETASSLAEKAGGSLERAQMLAENNAGQSSADPSAIKPNEIYSLSQRIARYRSAARARKDVGAFLEELETEALCQWRTTGELRILNQLSLILQTRQALAANITPSLLLEHLLLDLSQPAAGSQIL
ncbi:MAG: hypothetical protein HY401_08705 [Elusimicrobia bacterium]|nr:hypothetical protein [Elusimicrobiota bacterium]